MSQTVRDRTNRIVSDVLGAPLTAIGDDSSPDTIDGWNSLAHLNLVLALEAEFEVTPVTQRQLAEIQNHYDMSAMNMKPTGYYLAFEIGCTNWRGVVDDEGKELPFKIRNLSKIPVKIAMEVGAQVVNVSALTEDDRKNL